MFKTLIPYLLVALLAASAGAGIDHLAAARTLADEQAVHAKDNEQHANDMLAISRAALDGEQRAIDAHNTAQSAIAAADVQITKEKETHEADNRNYRATLAAGTERVHVAVTGCSAASGNNMPRVSSSAGVGDGASAYADLDRAVAERVYRVAGDDQLEIDKLKAMQAYTCGVRPATPGCENNSSSK
jgi:prophage endopeptidase